MSHIDKRVVVCYKTNNVLLKTYNSSNIEQLGICTVRLRHKDNVNKCRFFVVPGNGPVLLQVLDIEVLGILKITCEVIDSQLASSKYDSHIAWLTDIRKCKTHQVNDPRKNSGEATEQTNETL